MPHWLKPRPRHRPVTMRRVRPTAMRCPPAIDAVSESAVGVCGRARGGTARSEKSTPVLSSLGMPDACHVNHRSTRRPSHNSRRGPPCAPVRLAGDAPTSSSWPARRHSGPALAAVVRPDRHAARRVLPHARGLPGTAIWLHHHPPGPVPCRGVTVLDGDCMKICTGGPRHRDLQSDPL